MLNVDTKIALSIIERTFLDASNKTLPSNEELLQIVKDFFNFSVRSEYTNYCFPLLSHEFLEEVVGYLDGLRVIEVGAGGGWLSEWIKRYGGDVIIATDDFS